MRRRARSPKRRQRRRPSSASPSPSPSSSAEQTCGVVAPAGVTVEDLQLEAAGGVTLNAAAVGSGSRAWCSCTRPTTGCAAGCPTPPGWAGEGFSVLAFDFRCTFASACPRVSSSPTSSAMSRQRWTRSASAEPPTSPWSGPPTAGRWPSAPAPRSRSPAAPPCPRRCSTTSWAAASRRTTRSASCADRCCSPLLPDDGDSPIDANRTFVAQARKGVVTFVELPAGAGHGWDTVINPTDPTTPSPFAAELEAFLARRLVAQLSSGRSTS